MPPSLLQTERWMKAIVVHPGTAEEAIQSRDAARQIAPSKMPVRPSKTLTAHQRVDVYREMYWLRLREALAIDYPELKRLLGDDTFDELCDTYVQQYPSRSYSLNRLGDHLPRFLTEAGYAPLKRQRPFATDLARLELLMTEVFDEEETPVLDEEQVARIPVDAWDTMKLQAIPALRTGEFRYPVSPWITAMRAEQPAEQFLKRKPSFVIVCRRKHSVYRLDVSRTALRLFAALTSGMPLGDAVASVRGVTPALLQEWFQNWVAHRVFRAVATPQSHN